MRLILDSTVLIAFYTELKRPELLRSLAFRGYRLIIPKQVFEEISYDKNFQEIERDYYNGFYEKVKVPEDELTHLKYKFPSLHKGELAVLWIGQQFYKKKVPYKCVLDDGRARKSADKLGLEKIGTIGLLDLMCNLGIISKEEKRKICLKLIEAGFWFPPDKC